LEIVAWVLISAIPAVGLVVLGIMMRRWGAKHDPMGGRPGDVLPLDGESRRSRVYHD
jgi:hypothetical protein